MTEYTWSWKALSDTGMVRAENEDSAFASPEVGVFLVADGMGGHAAGEEASAIAARTIGDKLCAHTGDSDGCVVEQGFLDAFADAEKSIAEEASVHSERRGMGTTASALVVHKDGCYGIGHIGDSRIYLFRAGKLDQLTLDHSWVQEQVTQGLISPEQARGHPQSNIITRALGASCSGAPDVYRGEAQAGDVFLMTTDGLTDMLTDDEIAGFIGAEENLDLLATTLVDQANRAGGRDNITVLLVRIEEAAA
ncbi:MAG: PP2C family serine/threonine-protein phosphatase [Gemmatimonadota bacterium]